MDRAACWATVHGVTKSWRVGHNREAITSHSDQVGKYLLCRRTQRPQSKTFFLIEKKHFL